MADRTLVASATNLLARGYLVVPTDRRSPGGEPVNALFAVARDGPGVSLSPYRTLDGMCAGR